MTAPAMSSSIWRAMYTKLLSLAVNAANSACCFSCGNCNIVASATGLVTASLRPLPIGRSQMPDVTKRCRTSNAERPYSQLRQ